MNRVQLITSKVFMNYKVILFEVLGFSLACTITFLLKEFFEISVVVASASVGLVGTLLLRSLKKEYTGIHAAIYSGSFAGMCSGEIIQHGGHIVLLILIGCVVYTLSRKLFIGIGGKLGGISFVSVLIFLLFKEVFV